MKTNHANLVNEMPLKDNRSSSLRLAWPPPQGSAEKMMLDEVDGIIAAARAKERKLIGQELHDNVNQILMTVKLYLEMMRSVAKKDRGTHQKSISYVMMAINEIRTLSGELMAKKKDTGLIESIKTIVEDISLSTAIKIKFNYNEDIEILPEDKKQALLRIVQEQTKNIIKHSKASKVKIDLDYNNDTAFLQIKDNGVGFNPDQKRQGIGLSNILERVQSANGNIDLKTAKGKGCSLSIILPAN